MRQTRDRRAVLRRLKELGATVEQIEGTGELRLRHPRLDRYVRWNMRRQDMPARVIWALEQIERRR